MYGLIEARGWLPLVLCGFVVLLAFRCFFEAWRRQRSGSGATGRQILVGLALMIIAPMGYHPHFAVTPAFLAVALAALALETRRNRLRPILDGVASVVLLAGVGLMVSGYALSLSYGPSMWPASPKGFTLSVMETQAYASHAPARGDKVQVWVPRAFTPEGFDSDRDWPGGRYHKRIFGLPGDHVKIDKQGMFINGRRVADCTEHVAPISLSRWLCRVRLPVSDHPEAKAVEYLVTWGGDEWFWGPTDLVVPDGKVFVLGDNLTESADSRDRGVVSMSWIVGRHI